jgi:hypothetical protein
MGTGILAVSFPRYPPRAGGLSFINMNKVPILIFQNTSQKRSLFFQGEPTIKTFWRGLTASFLLMQITLFPVFSARADLPEIKARGVLRHVGVPYANFVTGTGDGLDVELVTLFAQDLGV